jgi:hypothetical protein
MMVAQERTCQEMLERQGASSADVTVYFHKKPHYVSIACHRKSDETFEFMKGQDAGGQVKWRRIPPP